MSEEEMLKQECQQILKVVNEFQSLLKETDYNNFDACTAFRIQRGLKVLNRFSERINDIQNELTFEDANLKELKEEVRRCYLIIEHYINLIGWYLNNYKL